MANINQNIRYYQPNDPYYWEVDNLPLTDLLNNDVILQQRLTNLEEAIGGLGGGTASTGGSNKGSVSLNAISDLKAWSEPLSGTATNFGKVFVRPGKFISRMQLPATRESGWRMMRDKCSLFNNERWNGPGGGGADQLNTTTLTPFVRGSHGAARTAVVEFYTQIDGSDKSVAIESFDAQDFNEGSPPIERLDLIYIKGSKSLDTDGDTATTPANFLQNNVPNAELGVIKGAYFRTDAAGGIHTNGVRFTNPLERLRGRTTGMGMGDLPVNTNLPGFGTVPMPDDLNNFAWHPNTDVNTDMTPSQYAAIQVTTQASFSLPVAYVRVPSNYTEGDPLPAESIIDIRPFFRTAEMTGSERQAIATSWDPNGKNPFITKSHLLDYYDPLDGRVGNNTIQVNALMGTTQLNTSRIVSLEDDVSGLKLSVSGTGTSVTTSSLNHEGRITALETTVGAGGPQILVERHRFLSEPVQVFSTVVSQLGTAASPKPWAVSGIPANDVHNIVALQFRIVSEGGGDDTDSINRVYMKGGIQNFRKIAVWGVAQSNGDLNRNDGMVNTFMGDSQLVLVSNTEARQEIYTYATGSSDVQHSLYVDGYIVQENA